MGLSDSFFIPLRFFLNSLLLLYSMMSVCTSIGHHTSVQDKENERLRQIIKEVEPLEQFLWAAEIYSFRALN